MVSHAMPPAVHPPTGNRTPRGAQPHTQAPHEALIAAMLEEPGKSQRTLLESLVSVIVHVAVLAALVIVPLYFTDNLNLQALENTWLTAPPPPPPPPPPAPSVQRAIRQPVRLPSNHLFQPPRIPPRIVVVRDAPSSNVGVEGGVEGGIAGGEGSDVLRSIIGTSTVPTIAAPAAPVHRVVRVGGNVKEPKGIYTPQPEYPAFARQAGIQGTVVIDAIIDEHGNVVQERVVSGPPLLLAQAVRAVANWKYEPTTLNGEPVSIEMHVEVRYTLN